MPSPLGNRPAWAIQSKVLILTSPLGTATEVQPQNRSSVKGDIRRPARPGMATRGRAADRPRAQPMDSSAPVALGCRCGLAGDDGRT